jgi:isoquinoline 1-oxidoreductase beta subunit
MTHLTMIERRAFLGSSAVGALTLAVGGDAPAAAPGETRLNAYVQVTADNRVSIVMPGCEIGQGVYTGLSKILCEELEADWDKVEIRLATADQAYANPAKKRQSTGGSDAVIGYSDLLLKTGAQAREMLVAAAAQRWKVPADQCRAENGVVHHDASGRTLTFGDVAEAAARLPVPSEPKLKSPDQWKLIGKDFIRKDTPAKVDGSADFGADVKVDGLLVATLVHAPVYGGQLKHYDEAAALAVKGVVKLVPIDNGTGTGGLAAVAENYHQARRALEAAKIEWDFKGGETLNSAQISVMLNAAVNETAAKPFPPAKKGDVDAALAAAAKTIDVVYEVPFLAHACMEPMATTAMVTDDACMVWSPHQQQGAARESAAQVSGLPLEKVTLQGTFAGGGFGRKWEIDFSREAVQIAIGVKGRPVRVYWSREQDIQHDYYRPAVVARYRAGIDADGKPTAMHARAAGPSIFTFQKRPAPIGDPTVIGGMVNTGYAIPNLLADLVEKNINVPLGFWRSVSSSHSGFFLESAIDELAALAGKDPLALRRELLAGKDRELAVLDAAAARAGWGTKLPAGKGMGLAYSPGFGSFLAQVATVSVDRGRLTVEKLVCVADCGTLIEPNNVIAQLESGIVYGLTAALFGEITIENGAAKQGNFTDYPMVTLANMPALDIQLMPSRGKSGGVGEASVPGVAPAIANAIFAATGLRIRRLPLSTAGLSVA